MNAPIRPTPPFSSLGTESFLPGIAVQGSSQSPFTSLLEKQLTPRAEPHKEPAEPEEEKEPADSRQIHITPFGPATWTPPPPEPTAPAVSSLPVPAAPEPAGEQQGETPSLSEIPPPELSAQDAAEITKNAKSDPAIPRLDGLKPVSEKEAREILARLTAAETEKPQLTGQKNSGMPAAKQEPMLLRSQKQNEIAARPEQNLPVAGSLRAAPLVEVDFASSPVMTVPFRVSASEGDRPANISSFLPGSTEFQPTSAGVELVEVAPSTEIDLPLAESINEHIQILRSSGEDSLEVTLTPDAETELFLRIEKIEGEICIRVRFERGHFADLEFQWPHLQQVLATQGIRVENLSLGDGQHHDFSGQQHSSSERSGEPETAAPRPSVKQDLNPVANSSRPRLTTLLNEGWQSWA